MIFLEPRTRDVRSIKEYGFKAGRKPHKKCLAYIHSLQCCNHHTAWPGSLRLALCHRKNIAWRTPELSGSGLPSGRKNSSVFGIQVPDMTAAQGSRWQQGWVAASWLGYTELAGKLIKAFRSQDCCPGKDCRAGQIQVWPN